MEFSLLSLIYVIGIIFYVNALNLNHINGNNQVKHTKGLAVESGITRHALRGKNPIDPGLIEINIGKDRQRPQPVEDKLTLMAKSFVKPTESRRTAIVGGKATARNQLTANEPNNLKKIEDALRRTEQTLAKEIKNLKKSNPSIKDYPYSE